MKLLLVFALFGITCCMAVPACTEADLMKCQRKTLDENATEEQFLNRDCRHTQCILELYDRCGEGVFPQPRIPDYFPVKGYRKILESVCNETNPIRKKYLDTVACTKKAIETYYTTKGNMFRDCGIGGNNREEFCRNIPSGLQCLVDYFTEECGKDAGEAYLYGNANHYDPYDCLS